VESIIVINPGSTSTKLSVYSFTGGAADQLSGLSKYELDLHEVVRVQVRDEISSGNFIQDLEGRKKRVHEIITENNRKTSNVIAVAGRGGLLKPLKSGVYKVNDDMLNDLISCRYGEHASNMGAVLAKEIGDHLNVDAFITDPVVVDEMDEISRYTGFPEIRRKSIFHALNQKYVAKKAAYRLKREYEEVHIIVAHLGGGISVGLHSRGQVVDVNNALDGDGPFSIERSGGIPAGDLIRICFSGRFTYEDLYAKIVGNGGIYAHLGTKDAILLKNILMGNVSGEPPALVRENVKHIIDACIYQVSKSICALGCYTCGQIDAIVLTGGIAFFSYFVEEIKKRVSFLSKNVFIFPGEEEMRALCENVLFAVKGIKKISSYRSEI